MLLLLLSAASLLAGVYADENLSVGTPLLVSSFATRSPSCSNAYPIVNLGAGNTTDECTCVVTNGSIPANTKDWYATKLSAASLVSSVRISGVNTSIDVLVGYEFAANMSLNEFSLCTRYNAANNAQKVNCMGPVRGSVVALRALDDTSQLHICGVDVFGTSRNMLLASQNISWQVWSPIPAPQDQTSQLVDGDTSSCLVFNANKLILNQMAVKFVIPDGVSLPFRAVVYHANVPVSALKTANFQCSETGLSLSIITGSEQGGGDSTQNKNKGIQCQFVTASVASSVVEYECTCPQGWCYGELAISPFSSSFQQPWRICEVILFPQCLAGTVAPVGVATCTQCPAGTAAPAGVTACTPCPVGTFSSAGAATCTPCPAGTYQNAIGQTSCVACPAGKYQSAIGQSSCINCVAGTNSTTIGATSATTCVPCPIGAVASAGATNCTACSAGNYHNATGQAVCGPTFQKCVRNATVIQNNTCNANRVGTGCPLHYDSDGATYVGYWLDIWGGCGVNSTCACQTGYNYDSGSNRCVRQTTMISTSSCTSNRLQSGCPLHYDSDKTTYIGLEIDYSAGCGVSSSCACKTGFPYDSGSKRCVRQATIINTSPCSANRVSSGCPMHYDSDQDTYVGTWLDDWVACDASRTCACQSNYTYDSGSNRCVRKVAITNTSSCSSNRVNSGCPLHYDSDKITYVGSRLDWYGGCGVNSTCACEAGFTYDSGNNKCVRQATIISTSSCSTHRMSSGCPLHYESDKTTYVGSYLDYTAECASGPCTCYSAYKLIVW